MNLSINPNYQNFSFTGSKQRAIAGITASLAAAAATAKEINRSQQASSVEVLKDKMNNNPIFLYNSNIQENKNQILSYIDERDVLPKTSYAGGLSTDSYIEEKSMARIKVLDCYSESQKMQENNLISKRIGTIAAAVKNNKQAELVVKMLKHNTANDDEKFFDNLANMLKDNIQPQLMEKVLSNKELYSNINSSSLYKIRGYKMNVATKISSVLDSMLDDYNKKFKDSVSAKELESILVESFVQIKEDPIICYVKLFQEASDTNLDAEIDNAIFNIALKDKDSVDELNQCLGELRALRDSVKNSYRNKVLEPVADILNDKIEEYKSIREKEFGVAADSEADKNDSVEYEEIKAFWKE